MLWEHTTGHDPVKSAQLHTGCCEHLLGYEKASIEWELRRYKHPRRQRDTALEAICFRQQNEQFPPWLHELLWEPLPTLSTELVGCWWSQGAPNSLP